jgi:peptidoglycan/LPS O-acetylase OafA/YrhL
MYATFAPDKLAEGRLPAFRLGHRAFLDGVRGIAVLLVLVFHFSTVNEFPRGGFLGVDLFFVLSGFLISAMLLEEHRSSGRINLKNFYARRALRLLPALVVVSLTSVIISGNWRPALYALFYVANWVLAFGKFGDLGLLEHTWSLSIEEQFYLFYPLLLLFLFKVKRRYQVRILLGLIALVAINRAYLYSPLISIARLYAGLDARADSLLIGCVVGFAVSDRVRPKRKLLNYVALGAAILMVGFLYRSHFASPYLYCGGYTIFSACAGVLLFTLFQAPPALVLRILENPLLTWIGRISYGLYLWNPLMIKLINPSWPTLLKLVLQIVILLVIVSLSYYGVELPFLRLKRRFHSPALAKDAGLKPGASALLAEDF